MKQRILEKLGIFILILCFAQVTQAQVTIGSGIKPNQGAILDIKQYDDDDSKNGGRTAKKGLGLPRVALVAVDQLEPCTVTNTTNKASHTSLTVYNITDNSATIATLKEGVYTWDGETWQPMGLKGAQGFGPWYQVDNPTLPSREVDTDSYLKGKAVVGGESPIGNAQLSVHGTSHLEGNVGIGAMSQNNASLTLEGGNKGFMAPKVALKSNTDNTTIALTASDKAMVVYHTDNTVMEEGLYSWNGGSWKQMITQVPDVPVVASNIRALMRDYTSTGAKHNDEGQTATTLDFGTIPAPEIGSYAFSLRLYGSVSQKTEKIMNNDAKTKLYRGIFYFFAYKNNVRVDAAEINIFSPGLGRYIQTQSVTLTVPNCQAGDLITIRIGHYVHDAIGNVNDSWTLSGGRVGSASAATTSLAFWKL